MLAVEIELLGGRYAATAHNDRSQAEWPPHPARFYSALVAALHDNDPVDADERAALLWLEEQSPPALDVDLSVSEHVGRRTVRSVFVPVNDVTLFGKLETDIRSDEARLEELERRESREAVSSALRTLRKKVAKKQAELQAFIGAIDSLPSKDSLRQAVELLPERRNRQERTFPVVVPSDRTVSFIWPDADPGHHREALRRLCDRVTRLGHSSSLVRCFVTDTHRPITLVPSASGDCVLRTVGQGQLARLEAAYERHRGVDPRVLPARPQRYGTPKAPRVELPRTVFSDEWIVFERIDGDRPLSSRGIDFAQALRRALIEVHGTETLPMILSGHGQDGAKATAPHVAFVACPHVGHEHADGSVQGLAIVPPQSMSEEARRALMQLLASLERQAKPEDDFAVQLGTVPEAGRRKLSMRLRRVEVSLKRALAPARWCRAAQRFITATPIALDRHPGRLRSNVDRTAHKAAAEAEASVADACERVGLPRPSSVSISFAPLLPGAQHVRDFAPWPQRAGQFRRARVHADIVFPQLVRGPLLVGAGRYFGLGLCLPVALESVTRGAPQ